VNDEFLKLADKILRRMEAMSSPERLASDYVYKKIPVLVQEVMTSEFSSASTDIGLAAIKLEGPGMYSDKQLMEDILQLGDLYRLIQKPAARK